MKDHLLIFGLGENMAKNLLKDLLIQGLHCFKLSCHVLVFSYKLLLSGWIHFLLLST